MVERSITADCKSADRKVYGGSNPPFSTKGEFYMNRIVWMADEIIARTRPQNWNFVVEKCNKLFSIIGSPNFIHEVISPQTCIGPLAQQLIGTKFSTIVDLTDNGWLSDGLCGIFPSTPMVKELHISRVRDVSNPHLPTSGHVINVGSREIEQIRRRSDLSHPLILDDVSFSGKSSEMTMRLLELDPKAATHGFLILNVGDLGQMPGAKKRLENLGSRVFTGHTLNTSENEDGWHIKDFSHHGALERTLGLVVVLHEIIQQDGSDSEILKRLFKTKALQETIFPFTVPSESLTRLREEGRFIPTGQLESLQDGVHTTNPNLLASPYFLDHISISGFRQNLNTVSELLHEIQLLSKSQEGQKESVAELRHIAGENIIFSNPEFK